MQGITPFLWFNDQALEAAQFYVSILPNSRILGDHAYLEDAPGPTGSVMTVEFEVDGTTFTALNGGPVFAFTPAISFVVHCEDQDEVDYFWERLSDGGEESQCGWLVDRFGVSWQVVPTQLGGLIGGPDPEGAGRAMQAMLQMRKLDIAVLQTAYDGVATAI
jgi:predicted 3-demethylubiquinone-9 3-methyltransferase (glyoxalase superfamily)